ncbi:hypothetical protein [Pseudogulbenkiania sp. MAI-1]|uniref:hypothetical protein n=1 Tax=Pseudogulbenkiania sp. MAI-1 TaxID=990370 RepID=UPI00045EA978|nr:hypothetical protein [Pseudogulbenkiania sp. MAI-1]
MQHSLERAERKFDPMQELGTNRILVCSSVQPEVIRDDMVIAGAPPPFDVARIDPNTCVGEVVMR